MTAAAWYRPKRILKNGVEWVDSQDTDYRPLLMTWWPNATVQADYLNFMKSKGLLDGDASYSSASDLSALNQASAKVQQNIESKLSARGAGWLRDLMNEFVSTESIWNANTENVDYAGLQLQGGFLKYENSDATPNSKSDWRLMNRAPLSIKGTENGFGGSEFLLANDIDNSNPVVQAEELNWLHYLLNFGSIVFGDDEANFDSIRVDAVDNVNADLLNIAGDYFTHVKNAKASDAKANSALNILEDWSWDDAKFEHSIGTPQLTMDAQNHAVLDDVLGKNSGAMARLISEGLVNRANNDVAGNNDAVIPNYNFFRAHDYAVQDEVRRAIQDTTGKPYGEFNFAEEQAGMAAYIADQNSTVKKYNRYNVPSAYAYLLTIKDSIPRIYYGDLYTDGGQYMETKTRYFDAITNLLKARIKYVAGGQAMSADANDVLTSVRFGKDAYKVDDLGTAATRTSGIGVVISNNKDLAATTAVLHMGKAHANQAFRALVLTTESGVVTYTTDAGAPTLLTDANGDLVVAVKGYANPDVTGYLGVWVPVGASANQDVRTLASNEATTDGHTYHANAALDSNIIYEGFSNFIYYPTTPEEAANVKIAQNVDLFKSWGVTSFEMAP